ncbi:ghrl_felca ame: full=appetite-regulating hormone [Lynx pardinus]|uniref:Appetite-regulating hormone n=1 Tax=Lynx pardinus TaxID=191816 RepID=A0A485MI82_LYNPA|nr:ghrl_felca ame: full=appetite-regulating hormone [Lynx pardinus]
MPSPGTVCSLLLFSVLWADLAMAGSSFLSPEHQKVQQRKESKKPPAKLQPRALEGLIHPEDTSQVEGAEDELEIRVGSSAVLCFCDSGREEGGGGQAMNRDPPTDYLRNVK